MSAIDKVFVVSDWDQIIGIYTTSELAQEAMRRVGGDNGLCSWEVELDKLPQDRTTKLVAGMGI